MHYNVLAVNNVMQQQTGPFRRCVGVIGVHRQRGRGVIYVAACVRFVFGKTSLALVAIFERDLCPISKIATRAKDVLPIPLYPPGTPLIQHSSTNGPLSHPQITPKNEHISGTWNRQRVSNLHRPVQWSWYSSWSGMCVCVTRQ